MTMRRTGCFRFLVASICCHSAAARQHYTAVLDLSYKSHLKATTLGNAVRDVVGADEPPVKVELDVSFSELGNEGLAIVMESLTSKESPLLLDLAARMNRLTPDGVSTMLTAILDEGESTTLQSLDLGWNNLSPDQPGSKQFLSTLRKLIESPKQCPTLLRLYRCGLGPAACRALGKGIMKRFESTESPPLSLHLCGNEAIGDAGTAALAAAIRSSGKDKRITVKELDLSSCGVGDAGAEALALALEKGCVKHVDVSSNKISDDGAAAIGRSSRIGSIDLSNNHEIGDAGAAAIASALEHGMIEKIALCSCHVHADGAKALGAVLPALSKNEGELCIEIDLSGNALGVLRGKKKSDGGKYSASNLKSKASATTASYMNFIQKKIRSGLKESGLDAYVGGTAESGESDDEEDERMGVEEKEHPDASKARCGAKAFASAIVVGEYDGSETVKECKVKCCLSVRHCFLDRGGADALAAAVQQARDRFGVELVVDARMNPVLEEEMIEALRGDDPVTLEEMAERHLSVLETLRIAEERAEEAAAAAAARRREEDELVGDYGGMDFDRFAPEDDDEYDSDARYDDYDDEDVW